MVPTKGKVFMVLILTVRLLFSALYLNTHTHKIKSKIAASNTCSWSTSIIRFCFFTLTEPRI